MTGKEVIDELIENLYFSISSEGSKLTVCDKAKYSQSFEKLRLNDFDWNDLDGILDFLYGTRKLGVCKLYGVSKAEVTELINFIESNSEVHSG